MNKIYARGNIMEELIFHPLDKDNPGEYISGCDFIGGVYLHGVLQDKAGYDLIQTDTITKGFLENAQDGIYDVTVCIKNKKTSDFNDIICFKSKLFFWETDSFCFSKQFRGLICAIDDTEALKDAQEKFEKRSFWL